MDASVLKARVHSLSPASRAYLDMGNNLSGATTRVSGALDSYVSELGADIVYEKRYFVPIQ